MPVPLEVTDPAGVDEVDWQGAFERRVSAESAEAGEDAAPEAQPREFKYRGKSVKVDPATYEILESLRREARGTNGRLGSELHQTKERLAKLEGMLTARADGTSRSEPELQPPDPLLATRDIVAYQRELLSYNDRLLERQQHRLEEKYLSHVAEVKTRVEQNQRETQWANGFYEKYDHLDHPDLKPIVAQVYTENKPEIDALGDDLESAYDRLAELTDARLVRVARVGKEEAQPQRKRPPRIESAAGAASRGEEVEPPAREFTAASWVAKQRLKMTGRAK